MGKGSWAFSDLGNRAEISHKLVPVKRAHVKCLKSLSFKLCATTCNRVCKRTQHVSSNNVPFVCTELWTVTTLVIKSILVTCRPRIKNVLNSLFSHSAFIHECLSLFNNNCDPTSSSSLLLRKLVCTLSCVIIS